jgi:hypothetical protein
VKSPLSEPLREGKEFIEHVAGTVADGVPEELARG